MIRFKGRELSPLSPETARQSGIEIVTQHNPLFDDFTVANNILVNNRFRSSPFFNSKQLKRTAGQFLQATGFDLDPSALLKNLNQSDRVVVDILKHIYPQPELLILDEALEKLSAENLERIIAILRAMKQKGTAILFITHRIDDIYTFADRVSIMRDGHILLTDSVDRIDKINIIRLAYTQFLQSERGEQDTTLFYQLLKYNQAILENLPINLIVIDENGSVKLINESAKHFFSATLSSEPGDIEALFSTMPKQITDGIADSIREKKEQ
jgi:ABC-type sugar transport system ATPase subunit